MSERIFQAYNPNTAKEQPLKGRFLKSYRQNLELSEPAETKADTIAFRNVSQNP